MKKCARVGAAALVALTIASPHRAPALSPSARAEQQQGEQTETLCTSFPNYSCVVVNAGPRKSKEASPAKPLSNPDAPGQPQQRKSTTQQPNTQLVCTSFPHYSCNEIYMGREQTTQASQTKPQAPAEAPPAAPATSKEPQTKTVCVTFPQYSCTEIYVGPGAAQGPQH